MTKPQKTNLHGKNDALGRLPPHSVSAEQGVLGCVLLDPVQCLSDCAEAGVTGAWFYDLRHRLIWETLAGMEAAGQAIDMLTLQQRLKDAGDLDKVGGGSAVSAMPDTVPSAANLSAYLDILRDKFMERSLVQACTNAVQSVYEDNSPGIEAIAAQAEKEIQGLAEARTGTREQPIKPLLIGVVEKLEPNYHRGAAQIVGLTTGLEYLDKMLCGVGGENGNMFVVAGRPGTGKTSWALDLALHVSIDHRWFSPKLDAAGQVLQVEGKPDWEEHRGLPVGIFSLEMSAPAIVKKMLFQWAGADLQRWRTGFAVKDDFERLTRASAEIAQAQIWIDDTGRCSISELRAKARRWVREYGIRLFIVDYIQLMRTDGRRFRDDRVQELAEISGELQNLGKQLGVPFVVLAQMNRDYEKDPTRQPRLSDLKDCGAIEQDADVVGFLFRPRLSEKAEQKYEAAMLATYKKDWSRYPLRVDMLVAKNRFGPTGVVQMLFQHASTHFVDYVRWLKEHGQQAPAEGEREDRPGDLSSNQEMRL